MTEKRSIPAFQNEAEEARWWFDHREARDEEFARAIVEGRAGRNSLAARAARSKVESQRKQAESASSLPTATPQAAKHR